MKKILLFLLVLGLGAAAVWYATREDPVAVAVESVARGTVRSVVANTRVGTVKACLRAKMSPAAAGRVAILNVDAGDRVERDAILLEVWNEDLKAEVQLAETEISAARSRADEACAMSAGAEREANRLRKLSARKLVSEEAVDAAVTNAETRAAACKAMIATTWVQNAKLNVAKEKLGRTILRAPFRGVVAEVDAKLGEYLTPSPPGIATIPAVDLIDPGCLYVSAPIDEVDAPLIETGMSACVTLDAFAGKRCAARVKRIADYVTEAEKQARTVEVEVEFTNQEDTVRLLPGYSADIEVLIEQREDVLRVSTEAVLEGQRVLVFDRATSTLQERDIVAGLSDWEFTEIVDGLEVDELVVVSTGRPGVVEGASVVVEQ